MDALSTASFGSLLRTPLRPRVAALPAKTTARRVARGGRVFGTGVTSTVSVVGTRVLRTVAAFRARLAPRRGAVRREHRAAAPARRIIAEVTRGAMRPRPKGHHLSHGVVAWSAGVVVALLAVINVIVHVGGVNSVWVAPPSAVALLVLAHWMGLHWWELGLGRARLRAGLVWGGGAIAVIGVIYAIGVLLPWTRDAFRDARYHVGVGSALLTAFVRIPLSTVIFEEIAFRGLLWALLARHLGRWRVLGITSVLFGAWHILGAFDFGNTNAGVNDVVGGSGGAVQVTTVLGTVLFTTLGGLVFGEVRRRSGSLLASLGAHWATNGLGVLFGLWAWTLPR